MPTRTVPFVLCAAGVLAGGLLTRSIFGARDAGRSEPAEARHPFVVARDAPELGLERGERFRVDPTALIRVGDVVAIRSARSEIVLTRFHDELMHCTAGLVVRESRPLAKA